MTDPRRSKVDDPLIHIVKNTIGAVVAGTDDFVTIAAWRRQKRAWFWS